MLSALIVTGITKGRNGINRLFAKMINWQKVGWGWVLFALSPLTMLLFADPKLINSVNFLPNIGVLTLPLWVFTFGLGEETGWRGFALPKLQSKYSALKATLILSIFWIIWHIPGFFYLPNYIKLFLANPAMLLMFPVSITCGAIVFTWLFNSSKGNLLVVILFHGVFNFVTASKAGEGAPAMIISTLIMLWAVLIIFIYKPENLSSEVKQKLE